MSIKDINKSNKEKRKLKVCKMVLGGAIVLSLSSTLSGCIQDESVLRKEIQKKSTLNQCAGFIKNGDELIPFYYDDSIVYNNYHRLDTGAFIGHKTTNLYNDFNYSVVKNNKKEIMYTKMQIIYFNDVYPNVFVDAEIVADFDEDIYRKYEEKYLSKLKVNKRYLNHYTLECLETGEMKPLVGYQISNTQFFNYETYMLEEYKGYVVNCVLDGDNLESDTYSYTEVLDIIASLKEEYMSISK